MNAQRAENEALRREVESASRAAVDAHSAVASQIQDAIDEERRLAAEDRQQLLAQIGNLIAAQAARQESRLTAKANTIREHVTESNKAFDGKLEAYATGMDAWDANASGFIQEASKSRDALKLRLKEDWTVGCIV